MTKIPLHPRNPERVCWGCDKYCPATDLACGNGTIRTLHPAELFGDDWLEWAASNGAVEAPASAAPAEADEFAQPTRTTGDYGNDARSAAASTS